MSDNNSPISQSSEISTLNYGETQAAHKGIISLKVRKNVIKSMNLMYSVFTACLHFLDDE